ERLDREQLVELALERDAGGGHRTARGPTGSTTRPNVEVVTAAKDAYQAAAAVASPTKPPALVMFAVPPAVPVPSSRNRIVSSTNTSSTADDVRSAATDM